MGKVLALDVGEKTIGVALSDETLSYAFPGETIWRRDRKRDMALLRELVAQNDVTEIVVGLPLSMDETWSAQTRKVEAFIAMLRGHVRIPIVTQDERLTTWEAEQAMIANGKRRQERKRTLDSVAASLILRSYLDQKQGERLPLVSQQAQGKIRAEEPLDSEALNGAEDAG